MGDFMEKGLVHIYTGDGKGKTTAAFGLAVRCASYGKKVVVYQFLKATPTGEICACEKLGIDVVRCAPTDKFWFDMTEEEKQQTKEKAKETLLHIYDQPCCLLVLDEVICLADLGIISVQELIDIVKNKPYSTELVLTGRGMPEEITDFADYVSEVKCIKHPYEKNIEAREGIEF